MTFDQSAPTSAYWTPMKQATGDAKTKLALLGYKADGTQNLFGKFTSWIPGVNVLYNSQANTLASREGLSDVAGNVHQDLDNRLAKMNTLMGVGKTILGAATSNPEMIAGGVQSTLQGGASVIQAAGNDQMNTQGTQVYQRFADGGKPTVRKNRYARDTPANAPVASAPTNLSVDQQSAQDGKDWVSNWFEGRAAASRGGLTPDDAVIAQNLTTPIVTNDLSHYPAGFQKGVTANAVYMPGEDQSYVKSQENLLGGTNVSSAAAHETAHQLQFNLMNEPADRLPDERTSLLGNVSGKIGRAVGALDDRSVWQNNEATIQQAINDSHIKGSGPVYDYLAKPIEIHARLMQLRKAAGLRPDQTVDQHTYDMQVIGKMKNEGNTPWAELSKVLSEDQIIKLLNKTVDNTDYTKPTGEFRAAEGGTIYPEHDKTTEDIVLFDKKHGHKVGEMRYHERIFDQHATQKMEELADKKDTHGLGLFVLQEMNTHPDRQHQVGGMFRAAGGGKPRPRTTPAQRQAIMDEQRRLQAAGLYSGKIDGIVGPKTQAGRTAMQARVAASAMPTEAAAAQQAAETAASIKPTAKASGPTPSEVAGILDGAGKSPVASDGETPPATGGGTASKTDWLGMGTDALRAISSAIGAAQPLPTRPLNPNLLAMQRELGDRRNEGLSAGERVNLLRSKAATQQANIQAIKDTVGGGGSAASVLQAINNADAQANAAGQGIEDADRKQRQLNQEAYYSDLQNSQQGSDNIFAQQYSTAVNNRNAFTQALGANLQNAADRQQYNQSYGQGSPYYNLMMQMMRRTGQSQAYADAPVNSLIKP